MFPKIGHDISDHVQGAKNIDLKIFPRLFLGQFFQGSQLSVARIVHHHIEGAEMGDALRNGIFYLRIVG